MNTVNKSKIPDIAFLGVCERATFDQNGPPHLWRYNILGLKNIVISQIFPLSLVGFQFLIAIYDPLNFAEGVISVRLEDGKEMINFTIKLESEENPQLAIESQKTETVVFNAPTWTTFLLSADKGMVESPGHYNVFLLKDNQEFLIGNIIFGLANVEPFTTDRIAAIQSDPNAAKSARFILKCSECGEVLKSYTGLNHLDDQEKNGFIWYEELPDRFKCKCGKIDLDLTILRRNMHGLLGRHHTQGDVSFTRLYEKDALEKIVKDFIKLLDLDPLEEVAYQFIKDHPILLHQFSPKRIFYKPPILSKYKADIVILNQKKELLLIELEKPGTRILKKDGGLTADAQRPFTQVNEWLHMIEEEKSAVLRGMDLVPSDVSKIRGIIIMGRNKGYNEEHFRKFKWIDFGKVDFYTYDDLVNSLVILTRNMRDL
jgi:hypothetical protein